MSRSSLGRRALLAGGAGAIVTVATGSARSFGEEGAFNPRVLLTGTATFGGRRESGPARWALEVVRRTSAPARLSPTLVRADAPDLLGEPFVVWTGSQAPESLTQSELRNLRSFLALGGVLFVDDQDPDRGAFVRGAKKQLERVLPQGSPIPIGEENVVFRSFYLLRQATGRLQKSDDLEAIVRGGSAQVIFSPNDLLGALAREAGGVHPFDVEPRQREFAIRLAVNVAMFVLCSNYKDDQVHAPFLMRRRVGTP